MAEPVIPDEAVWAYQHGWQHHAHPDGPPDGDGLCCDRAGLAAAYPILAEQWRRDLDGGPDEHVIDLRADGWTIRHPLSCRPNLFDYEVNRAAGRTWAGLPVDLGPFVCRVDDEGVFTVGDSVEAAGS